MARRGKPAKLTTCDQRKLKHMKREFKTRRSRFENKSMMITMFPFSRASGERNRKTRKISTAATENCYQNKTRVRLFKDMQLRTCLRRGHDRTAARGGLGFFGGAGPSPFCKGSRMFQTFFFLLFQTLTPRWRKRIGTGEIIGVERS